MECKMDVDLTSADGTEHLKSRPYQCQLEEIAIRQNTIIHLPTGSGKTFIAIRLIKRFRDALQKPWGEGGKRTFFLVNTVPLVMQQKKFIERLCPVNGVGAYSSEDRVDYWDRRKWDAELSEIQVAVMTSQILSDMLTHGYIRIEDINLLIFDECHHAVDDHPMRMIMKHFDNCPVNKQPRVLGLTATLLNANVNVRKVEETLRELEITFHATIATVNELGEVLTYSTNPFESVQYYKPIQLTEAAASAVCMLEELMDLVSSVRLPKLKGNFGMSLEKGQTDISTDPKKIVKGVKNIISGMVMLIKELGVYGGTLGILAYVILLERLKRKSVCEEEELLYTMAITYSTEARALLLDSMENEEGYEKIVKHSSAKFLQMLNVLREYNPTFYNSPGVLMKVNKARKPLSAIIFTQQRFTAKVLYNLLKAVIEANPAEFDFIKHDYLVGFNINPFKSTREQYYIKKASQKALLKFSNKELNCLIATSVIEEGVDVPQCLLVLRYDAPLEYRSYIQSKGRARSSESSFVMLINALNKEKFLNNYMQFQTTERYIQNLLIGNSDDRDAPTDEDIKEGLYDDEDVPPYITGNGNRLSATAAISLLSRYCSTLPHDQFTVITPMWIQEKIHDRNSTLRLITIIMPIACPVKEKIKGLPLDTLKSAKRSAALNACIRLHQEGELDELTLLPRRYGVIDFDTPEVNQCFPNWQSGGQEDLDYVDAPKPGTRKMVRKHKKEFPKCLEMPTNWKFGQRTFGLHIIKLKTAFQEPKDSRERALFNLLQRGEGYGILTPEPLPKLCDFPMFLTVGEVTTSLEVNYAVIQLNLQLFDLVKEFHFFLFDQVLEVAKKFLVFDGQDNNMFVVPTICTNGDYDIDWQVMKTYKTIRPVEVPSYEERKSLRVTRESHQYTVVTPWYRGPILPDRYVVSDVIEYMTPQTQFDTNSYGTFADYYSTKYNLEIFGQKDQPMLEVRNISTRMNCLMPRAATINSFSEKQQKLISAAQGDDKPKGFIEYFIPEFCIKYDFPGALWYKAILLPSILHRVFMLLISHDLREEIAKETNYGKPRLTKGEEWLPIEVDLQIAIKSLLSQIEEPTPVATVDRINNPIDDSLPRNINIVSMKDIIYQLQNKKLAKEFPWDERIEPVDIERNVQNVTLMDIECYDEFVSAPLDKDKLTDTVRSPERPVTTSAAILPPPQKYNDKIAILTKQPIGRGPELRDILAAITTINSRDTFDLERVETLGDSFLKFAASLYLYHKFPRLNEGQLTNIKGRLIGNRNLYYAGARKRLGGRMKVEQFTPRKDFLVPGFFAPKEATHFITEQNIRPTFLIGMTFDRQEALSGQLSSESLEMLRRRHLDCDGAAEVEPFGKAQAAMQGYIKAQAVSDKSVADCVEAIIGTYLLSGGIPAAVLILEWFKITPPQDNLGFLLHKPVPTALTENRASVKDLEFLLNNCRTDIEKILNYKFKDPSFLLEAMSHPSYIRNRVTSSYERLEFIGDAILDFLITAHIFENCRQLKPGDLTDLRSALVNNVTFASYVVKLGLYKFMCSQLNPTLDSAIMAFVEHQEQRDHEVIEDVLYLIDEDECHIAEYVEVPKVLSDLFESLAGAIYLDSGGDLSAVWAVIYRIMWKEIDAFSNRIPQQPVRVLYEKIHACPVFGDSKMTDSDVPKVMIPVTVTKKGRQHTVHGFGNNKFQAKRAAAKLALRILQL